jgi:serine/threonine-protein kinase RsbT
VEMFHIWETPDAIMARQRGREIAKAIGFSLVDQTIIAYTISEVALKLISISAKGHMMIRPVSLCKGDPASGIEVRLFDHFTGPSRIHLQWMKEMTDSLELSHDHTRGTMITFQKWVHAPLRVDSPIYAAGEE